MLFPASASLFATTANTINERGQTSGMAIDCCDVSSDHVSAIACAASITWPRSFAKLLDSMQEAASSCGDAKQGPDSAGDQLLGQGDLAHQNSRKALVLLSSDTADDSSARMGSKPVPRLSYCSSMMSRSRAVRIGERRESNAPTKGLITFGCRDGDMSEKELNLVQFPARCMARFCARTPQTMS